MLAEKIDTDSIKTICVLCWGLLGDVLIRTPTIEALRKRFPHAHITVVVDPSGREVLANHPDCSELIVYRREKRPLLVYLRGSLKHIYNLRGRRFDLCVDLYSGGSSPLVTLLINARIRLGFDHLWALRIANNVQVKYPSMCNNWAKALGTVLKPLGVSSEEVRRGTTYHCTSDAIAHAEHFLRDMADEYVGFNLGAGAAEKRWPVDRFVDLAIRVAGKYHFVPLVFTNPGMDDLADEFVRHYALHGRVVRSPMLSFDRVAGLMTRCGYIVTGDTSLMHLAFGLKRPTLGLFTHTRPEVVAPEDCAHTDCFVEDPSHFDLCGNPLGTTDIPVDYAETQFDELVRIVRGRAVQRQ
ncbi:MAG: glycosyltransferase family 9 protein [Acidiferrobacterales bacterium]